MDFQIWEQVWGRRGKVGQLSSFFIFPVDETIRIWNITRTGNINYGTKAEKRDWRDMMTGTGKTLNATIEDAYNFHVGLAEESDRGAAVLAVSRFEDVLRQAISIRLIDLEKKTQK